MLDTCVPLCGPRFSGITPSNTGGKLPSNSYSRIVATTAVKFGLYTPMLVRKLPVADPALARFVNTVTACAADDGSPGMNIPTDPTVPAGHGGLAAGEYRRDVTSRPVELEENSTAPSELGTLNRLTQMLSNALASRGASAKFFEGCGEHPAVAGLHRYVAVTFTTSVYDVLNTRTSEKNGAAPTTDAATGNVTVSATAARAAKRSATGARTERAILTCLMEMESSGQASGRGWNPVGARLSGRRRTSDSSPRSRSRFQMYPLPLRAASLFKTR